MATMAKMELALAVLAGGLLAGTGPASAATLSAEQIAAPGFATPASDVDFCGFAGSDCVAQATQVSPSSVGSEAAASGRVALTGSGLEVGASAFNTADTGSPRAIVSAEDSFTVDTVTGPASSVLDAVLNYRIDGELFVPSSGDRVVSVVLGVTVREGIPVRLAFSSGVIAQYGSGGHSIVASGGDPTLLSLLTSTSDVTISDASDPFFGTSGTLYRWDDVPLSLDLSSITSDAEMQIEVSLTAQASQGGGRADFGNTLRTAADPFVITAGPAGAGYRLTTSTCVANPDCEESLFGTLELEQTVLSVPEPAAPLLLGAALASALVRRRPRPPRR
jgi:hypothetical protein